MWKSRAENLTQQSFSVHVNDLSSFSTTWELLPAWACNHLISPMGISQSSYLTSETFSSWLLSFLSFSSQAFPWSPLKALFCSLVHQCCCSAFHSEHCQLTPVALITTYVLTTPVSSVQTSFQNIRPASGHFIWVYHKHFRQHVHR